MADSDERAGHRDQRLLRAGPLGRVGPDAAVLPQALRRPVAAAGGLPVLLPPAAGIAEAVSPARRR